MSVNNNNQLLKCPPPFSAATPSTKPAAWASQCASNWARARAPWKPKTPSSVAASSRPRRSPAATSLLRLTLQRRRSTRQAGAALTGSAVTSPPPLPPPPRQRLSTRQAAVALTGSMTPTAFSPSTYRSYALLSKPQPHRCAVATAAAALIFMPGGGRSGLGARGAGAGASHVTPPRTSCAVHIHFA